MSEYKILVVEDHESVRKTLEILLNGSGYQTVTLCDGMEAIKVIKGLVFDLYLIDLHLPGLISGIELLREIRKIEFEAVVIVMTAYGTIELAVEAFKAGAYDYLPKPFQVDLVLALVKKGLDYGSLKRENQILHKNVKEKYSFKNMIGNSPPMRRIFEMIEKVCDSDSTILIQGESGVGKEVIAKTIHFNSPRRRNAFIAVNCGAIPGDLLESEFFGYEKGAFTGAFSSKPGKYELAHCGSLFLDEISEMPLRLQVKLLRVLQEKAFERVGGTKLIEADVRIIAATNQDLEEAVSEKRFRKDLYYRLYVIPILVPPLREHAEDIPLLIEYFIKRFNEKKGRKVEGISPEALNVLMGYSWPGNIRELENLIERLMTFRRKGIILPGELPEQYSKTENPINLTFLQFPEKDINFKQMVTEFENHLINQAMIKGNGVKSRAARHLCLDRTTLVKRLKKINQMTHDASE